MRLRAILGIAAVVALALGAVAVMRPKSPLTAADSKIKVVATTSIIADWIRNVAGDTVDVSTLVGSDGDPHQYQPAPSDSIAVSGAKLIFENGLGLEPWLAKLYTAADSTATPITLTDGIIPRRVPSDENSSSNHASSSNASSANSDPHAWQNIANAEIMVGEIRDALAMIDPAHADADKARAADYISQLQQLEAWTQSQIDTIPSAHRKLVTSHDAFGYFGQRYGLDISRSALESVTTESADPSAKQVVDMVEQIKSSGVPVIFLENIENPQLMNQIASESHVQIGPPLYTDALGPAGSQGDTYIHMMQYNVRTIVSALK